MSTKENKPQEVEEHFFLSTLNKKIRNANKKLRDIKDLAKLEEETLNAAQREKIDSKKAIDSQIRELESVKDMFKQAEKEYNHEHGIKKQNKKRNQVKEEDNVQEQQNMPEPQPVDTKAIEDQAVTCNTKRIARVMHFANFVKKFTNQEQLVQLLNFNLNTQNAQSVLSHFTQLSQSFTLSGNSHSTLATLNDSLVNDLLSLDAGVIEFVTKFNSSTYFSQMSLEELEKLVQPVEVKQEVVVEVKVEKTPVEEVQVTQVPQNTMVQSNKKVVQEESQDVQQQNDEFMIAQKKVEQVEIKHEVTEQQPQKTKKVAEDDGFIEVKMKKKDFPEKQYENRGNGKVYRGGYNYKGKRDGDRDYKRDGDREYKRDGDREYNKDHQKRDNGYYRNRGERQERGEKGEGNNYHRGGYKKPYNKRPQTSNTEAPKQEETQN